MAELIRNKETGELGYWDGEQILPVMRHQGTGALAAWDGANLIAIEESQQAPEPQRKGFGATFSEEVGAGASNIAEGVKQVLRSLSFPGVRRIEERLQGGTGAAQAAIGGLQLFGAPFVATGAGVKELARPGIEAAVTAIAPYTLPRLLGRIKSSREEDIRLGKEAGEGVGDIVATVTSALGPQTVAKGVLGVIQKATAPFAAKMGPSAERVKQLASEFGVTPTAAQIRESPALAQLETFPQRFPIGVKRIVEFGEKQRGETLKVAREIGEKVSPEKLKLEEAGKLYKTVLYPEASKLARSKSDELYNSAKEAVPKEELFQADALLGKVDDIAKDTALAKGTIRGPAESISARVSAAIEPTKKLPKGAEATLAEAQLVRKRMPEGEYDKLVAEFGLDEKNKLFTFEGMDLLRKEIRSRLRVAERAGRDNDARKLRDLANSLSEDITSTANKFPEAAHLLDEADKNYRKEIAPFFTKDAFPRKLSNKDASQIVKTAIWGNRDRPENIELIKQAIKKPEEFAKISRAWWEDLVDKSFDPKTKLFSSGRLLTNYNKFTPEVKQSLLGPELAQTSDRMMELFSALERSRIAGENPSQTARGLLSAGQIMGAITIVPTRAFHGMTALATGQVREAMSELGGALGQLGVLLTPAGIARIVTSPGGIQWLTTGMQLQPGTKEATMIGSKLLGLANAIPRDQITTILKSEEVSIQDKISAAMGR